MWYRSIVRTGLFLLLFTLCISLSSLLASWFVTRQLSAALRGKSRESPQGEQVDGAPTWEIDFYEALGISREELQRFLRDFRQREQVDNYPALLTLQNSRGDFLVESRVIVRWKTGEHRLLVGPSGVVQFLLNEQMLDGLQVIAPANYRVLRQRSIALGNAYDPEENLDTSGLPFHVHLDGYIQTAITRGLARLRSADEFVPYEDLQEQLRSSVCALELARPRGTEVTAEEIYRLNRDSVVVIAHLYPDGHSSRATGFVLDASGVIATNYHVVDKPAAVARGVLTSAGRMCAVTQVLAADKSGDVVLLKIDATELEAAPLADSAVEGAAVTLIAHPNSKYYSLTRGHITRFWAATSHGRVSLRMGVTAEFAAGSSGAPLFDSRGNVTGIASTTENLGYQMVHRAAIPSQTIRKLIQAPADGPS